MTGWAGPTTTTGAHGHNRRCTAHHIAHKAHSTGRQTRTATPVAHQIGRSMRRWPSDALAALPLSHADIARTRQAGEGHTAHTARRQDGATARNGCRRATASARDLGWQSALPVGRAVGAGCSSHARCHVLGAPFCTTRLAASHHALSDSRRPPSRSRQAAAWEVFGAAVARCARSNPRKHHHVRSTQEAVADYDAAMTAPTQCVNLAPREAANRALEDAVDHTATADAGVCSHSHCGPHGESF